MNDVRQVLKELVEKAASLHEQERRITLESVLMIARLESRNAAMHLGMTTEAFAKRIGLSPDQYWKRAAAARVVRFFPNALAAAQAGSISVSHLSAISSKITKANEHFILANIPGKSKREVELFLSTVAKDGTILPQEAHIDLRLRLTASQLVKLDRAKEILSARGQVPDLTQIFIKALDDLLEKRDPMLKAQRAAVRQEKNASTAPAPGQGEPPREKIEADPPAPGQEGKPSRRQSIPAAIVHALRLRDEGQCTWKAQDGTRCPERAMLEIDHIDPWCRTKRHELSNLTLRCRRHNQDAARQKLGERFMSKWDGVKYVRHNQSSAVTGP